MPLPAGSTPGSRPARGFTLIELLLALAIIVIITAITIPTLINALDKGRQKRTMADLRLLGGSIEAYSVDNSTYPIGTDADVLDVLVPDYTDEVTAKDAWNHDLIYAGVVSHYTVGSPGKDGGNALTLVEGGGPTSDFDADIIYSVGRFLQWPEGTQD